jgi:hypothetical protein
VGERGGIKLTAQESRCVAQENDWSDLVSISYWFNSSRVGPCSKYVGSIVHLLRIHRETGSAKYVVIPIRSKASREINNVLTKKNGQICSHWNQEHEHPRPDYGGRGAEQAGSTSQRSEQESLKFNPDEALPSTSTDLVAGCCLNLGTDDAAFRAERIKRCCWR